MVEEEEKSAKEIDLEAYEVVGYHHDILYDYTVRSGTMGKSLSLKLEPYTPPSFGVDAQHKGKWVHDWGHYLPPYDPYNKKEEAVSHFVACYNYSLSSDKTRFSYLILVKYMHALPYNEKFTVR